MNQTKPIFVFDTNSLISGFILSNTTTSKALDRAKQIGFFSFSESTSREFANVFLRPKFDKYLSLEIRLGLIDDLHSLAILVDPTITITDCRDQKDNQFLELAVAANASCIVSGDQDLLVLNPFRKIPILTPANFLNTTF